MTKRPVSFLVTAASLAVGLQAAPPLHAQESEADVYVTAKDTGERLSLKPPVAFVPMAQPDEHSPTVIVDASKTFQVIEGIGGALTDAAAETWAKLPPESQRELLKAYYDPAEGIGYSLGRTHIHSCDFSSESYTYDDRGGRQDPRALLHRPRPQVPRAVHQGGNRRRRGAPSSSSRLPGAPPPG